MANTTITNLPVAVTITGNEYLEVVQNGTSVRITTEQIAALVSAAGTVTQINTSDPITGGPITSAGTISLKSQSVTNNFLAPMASLTLKGNLTGAQAQPSDVSPSAILNTFGTTQGTILVRGASGWQALTAGSTNQILTSNGTTAVPSWQTLSASSSQIAPTGVSAGTYGSASTVPVITVLASGQISAATSTAIQIGTSQVTGLGTLATQNASSVNITGGNINGTTIGATTAAAGTFTNFTFTGTGSFGTIASGTWTGSPVGVSYGGTGATTANGARTNLGAAASGANSDITSLSGLTTPLSATQGGTGFNLYTTGDLLYASSSTSLARLNDVATGNVLLSGGVGVAPSWGKVIFQVQLQAHSVLLMAALAFLRLRLAALYMPQAQQL